MLASLLLLASHALVASPAANTATDDPPIRVWFNSDGNYGYADRVKVYAKSGDARDGHWDIRALSEQHAREDDAETVLRGLVQQMSPAGEQFVYPVATYVVYERYTRARYLDHYGDRWLYDPWWGYRRVGDRFRVLALVPALVLIESRVTPLPASAAPGRARTMAGPRSPAAV